MSDRLQAPDAAWLRMNGARNPMVVTGLVTVARPLDRGALERLLTERLLTIPRFRQRVVQGGWWRPLRWEETAVELERHLSIIQAAPDPQRAGEDASLTEPTGLEAAVGRVMGRPLDPALPLWHLYLVEGLQEGFALIFRFHHSLGDGRVLLRVALSLTEPPPEGEAYGDADPALKATRHVHPAQWSAGRGLRALGRGLWRAARSVVSLGRLLLLPADEGTSLRGIHSGTKRSAWSAPLPVAKLKAEGARLGATLNDVLVAAVAGSLRRYLLAQGAPVGSLSPRAMIPVDLRGPVPVEEMGNRFGMVVLALPVGIEDPAARLAEVKRRMDRLKRSPEAVVAFRIVQTMGLLTLRLEALAVWIFARKASLVLTNVRGPERRRHLLGQPIRELLFWVPQAGRIGLGISIFSHAGEVRVGVSSDAAMVAEPAELARGVEAELRALCPLLRPEGAEACGVEAHLGEGGGPALPA